MNGDNYLRSIKNSVTWDEFSIEMALIFSKDILIYMNGKDEREIEAFIKTLEVIQENNLDKDDEISNNYETTEEWRKDCY